MSAFDVEVLRRCFPALAIEDQGRPVALSDGRGGTASEVDRLVDALARVAAAASHTTAGAAGSGRVVGGRSGEAASPDVAIIGGGIVGVSTAAFLAEAGARVRLYERSEVAAGASGRNSGVLQQPFDPVLAGLYGTSLEAYRALAADDAAFALPIEPAGLMLVGRDPEIVRQVAAAWARAWPDSHPEVLAGEDLRRAETSLAAGLVACRLAIGLPVEPAAATHAFARLATRRGAIVVVSEAAPAIAGGRVVGVRVGGRTEPAGAVLVAAGPWTPEVVDPAGSWRPIRPVWGVVASLAIEAAPRHVLEAADLVIEPEGSSDPSGVDDPNDPSRARGDPGRARGGPPSSGAGPEAPSDVGVDFSLVPAAGSSALGSTFLVAEPDPAAWLSALRRVGARYVPALATAELIGLRHCARPVSLDGRPLIGRVAGIDGLFVAAGHGPWGVSTGPGTARMIADLVLGRIADGAEPRAVDPNRFGSPAG
jgi:glycine/D-amino acid oxidase-like deaminating enzyme